MTLLDAKNNTFDCDLGFTMPQRVGNEEWPRIALEASRHLARAMNHARKGLLPLEHADARTCRAYGLMVAARLNGKRGTWRGTASMRCANYQGRALPAFYFQRGPLLVGEYREWSKKPVSKDVP